MSGRAWSFDRQGMRGSEVVGNGIVMKVQIAYGAAAPGDRDAERACRSRASLGILEAPGAAAAGRPGSHHKRRQGVYCATKRNTPRRTKRWLPTRVRLPFWAPQGLRQISALDFLVALQRQSLPNA